MQRRIGPYRLNRVVGRGGLGVVYLATDVRDGSHLAVKVLNRPADDHVAERRMMREFRALKSIEHRNIVRVLDAGVSEDLPYLAMELVDGLPLRAWLDVAREDEDWVPRPPPPPDDLSNPGDPDRTVSQPGAQFSSWLAGDEEPDSVPPAFRRRANGPSEGPLPPETLARLNRPARIKRLRDALAQLCDGLAFIHARALVHRDVKPSNILVEHSGCAKLLDFGLVKLTTSSGNTTAAGHVVGTYRYMSPEQAKSEPVDGRSDLYALGGVLYEMLSGRPPFTQQAPTDLLRAIVHTPPPRPETLNPDVDPTLAHIAMKLLQKCADERYQSAEEVAGRLRSAGRSSAT